MRVIARLRTQLLHLYDTVKNELDKGARTPEGLIAWLLRKWWVGFCRSCFNGMRISWEVGIYEIIDLMEAYFIIPTAWDFRVSITTRMRAGRPEMISCFTGVTKRNSDMV